MADLQQWTVFRNINAADRLPDIFAGPQPEADMAKKLP
jgi:hypothetical protein